MPKRVLQGVVASDSCDKTVTIIVERNIIHPFYKKTISRKKKYTAHDPENRFKKGQIVKVMESKPISKTKKWVVLYEDN